MTDITNYHQELLGSTPNKFEYDTETDKTTFSEVKPLGSTQERHVWILNGDQAQAILDIYEGDSSHLEGINREKLIQFGNEQGFERASIIVQGAIDSLIRDKQVAFFIETFSDSAEYIKTRNGIIPEVSIVYRQQFLRLKVDDIESKKLIKKHVSESISDAEQTLTNKDITLKAYIDPQIVPQIVAEMIKKGFKADSTNGETVFSKNMNTEGDEKSQETKPNWLSKFLR